ncbi:cytochrome P450 [Sorangium sp. So ce291]|uniref:cytochrome P450 n=1 Tax=Sorangium sp. So ce291 TaxID=3133294 RepID=UPI003F6457EC
MLTTVPPAAPGLLGRLFRFFFARKASMLDGLPGPSPTFPFGNTLELAQGEPHHVFARWHREYGDYLVWWFFGKPSLLVNDPALIREILVSNADDYHKNVPRGATAPIMGRSVFRAVGGADWQRKRAHHPFEGPGIDEWYEGILPMIGDVVAAHMEALLCGSDSVETDLFEDCVQMAFQVFGRAVLGTGLTSRQYVHHQAMLKEISRRGGLPVPFSPDPVFWYHRHRWLSFVAQRVRDAMRFGGDGTDLLSYMAKHRMFRMPFKNIRDEVSNVFFAGMRNVGISASLFLFSSCKHPDVGQRLRSEIDALTAEVGSRIDLARLRGLTVLDRVVKEAMRLYSVVPGFVREVKPDRTVMLGGHRLPASTQIFILPFTVHRNPRVWPDPLRFDPDRFLVEPPPGHYIPFGFGPRTCVGDAFTLICSKMISASILASYDIELLPPAEYATKVTAGTMAPRNGIRARVTRRWRRLSVPAREAS